MRIAAYFSLIILLTTGCLPGDQRSHSRELFPADSLSRMLGEQAPVDTLVRIDRIELPDVKHPVHFAWTGDRFYVTDTPNSIVYAYNRDGSLYRSLQDPQLEYPFIAGASGDTVAVLSRGRSAIHTILFSADEEPIILSSTEIPENHNAVAAWADGDTYVKFADEAVGSHILRISDTVSFDLEPPHWRHIGVLRLWGDTLVAASGYRPVVHIIGVAAPSGSPPDSLYLMGFDSPQLHRSRLFAVGSIKEPPLLIPSVAGVGSRLFVLNSRPGWVHIDVFRRSGDVLLIEHSLLSPQPELGRQFFASDLAVREIAGGFEITILENRPITAISRFFWKHENTEQY